MGLMELVLAGLCLNATCPDMDDQGMPEVISRRRELMLASERDLKGMNLVVATLENENLSGAVTENNTLVGKGVAFDLLDILMRRFEFSYTVVKPKSNTWGSDDRGILEMLKRNEADLSAAFLPIIADDKFTKHIRYSPILDTGEWVVLMKRPTESATGSGLTAPFTVYVWLLILLSLFVVGPVIYFIIWVQAKLCKDDNNKVFPLPSCIWFVYGALLKQGSTLNPTTDSSRLLFSTWWIFITILTAFYTANLTAFLTLSKFTLPINQPEDIGQKKTKWVTTRGNALEDTKENNSKILGYPYRITEATDSFILDEYVEKQNMMFIREKPIVEYTMYEDYKKKTNAGIDEAKRCTYVITKFSVASFSRGFAYSKEFKYKDLFDAAIQNLVESGIIKFKLRDKLPDTQICPMDLGNKERQLRNGDLLMTYMIVGGGFVVSAIVFAIEQFMQRLKNKKHSGGGILGPIKLKQHTPNISDKKGQLFTKNINNNNIYHGLGEFPSKFITPPPSYHTLFYPAAHGNHNIKKKNINGREYWVHDTDVEGIKLVPLRTPSALLFQFTH